MSGAADLPRRLADVLGPALGRLAGSDEARAYTAWARAVGDTVARGASPKAFRRGQLTIECSSSVWAGELTYLGPQILRRMHEVAPGHPVQRFRFVVGRVPAADEPATAVDPEGPVRRVGDPMPAAPGQGPGAATAKERRRDGGPTPDAHEAARIQAEGVSDERLRTAIHAALRRSSEEPR